MQGGRALSDVLRIAAEAVRGAAYDGLVRKVLAGLMVSVVADRIVELCAQVECHLVAFMPAEQQTLLRCLGELGAGAGAAGAAEAAADEGADGSSEDGKGEEDEEEQESSEEDESSEEEEQQDAAAAALGTGAAETRPVKRRRTSGSAARGGQPRGRRRRPTVADYYRGRGGWGGVGADLRTRVLGPRWW